MSYTNESNETERNKNGGREEVEIIMFLFIILQPRQLEGVDESNQFA